MMHGLTTSCDGRCTDSCLRINSLGVYEELGNLVVELKTIAFFGSNIGSMSQHGNHITILADILYIKGGFLLDIANIGLFGQDCRVQSDILNSYLAQKYRGAYLVL